MTSIAALRQEHDSEAALAIKPVGGAELMDDVEDPCHHILTAGPAADRVSGMRTRRWPRLLGAVLLSLAVG
ncbi:MAG: hypothetical protein M3432_08815, partial [Chloroflexota bacterium]|nr:hypothetical protein [Chloroflexota bacterium]